VRQELEKTMDQVQRPSVALRRWKESGAFATLIPALDRVSDVALSTPDFLPPPGLASRPSRRINRMAGLMLELGAKEAERVCRQLKCSNADASWVGALAGRWGDVGAVLEASLMGGGADDAALRRLAATVTRTRVSPFLRIAHARWQAASAAGIAAPTARASASTYRRALRIAWRDPIELADLALDGDDLRQAGVPSGPALGRTLHQLLELVIADPALNTREELLAHIPAAEA
jgi:tRNA nucleotidyltransferase (CCA-adding enzyme)